MSINSDLLIRVKKSEGKEKDIIKYIISLFQRESTNLIRTVNDEKASEIMRKIRADYLDTKIQYDPDEKEIVIKLIDDYVPRNADENQIREELNKIDFSSLKNKFAAIGIIKKVFNNNVDGELVKKIISMEY